MLILYSALIIFSLGVLAFASRQKPTLLLSQDGFVSITRFSFVRFPVQSAGQRATVGEALIATSVISDSRHYYYNAKSN